MKDDRDARRQQNRIVRAVVTFVAFIAAAVMAQPAFADNGDGTSKCNIGEICYARSNPAGTYQKDFWYSGDDAGYNWFDVNYFTGGATSATILNDMSSLWNRDTACGVYVVDYGLNRSIKNYAYFPRNQNGSFVGIAPSSMNDVNDAHRRCSVTNPQ